MRNCAGHALIGGKGSHYVADCLYSYFLTKLMLRFVSSSIRFFLLSLLCGFLLPQVTFVAQSLVPFFCTGREQSAEHHRLYDVPYIIPFDSSCVRSPAFV